MSGSYEDGDLVRKRTCIVCGEISPYDLDIFYHGGRMCYKCLQHGNRISTPKPSKVKKEVKDASQRELSEYI